MTGNSDTTHLKGGAEFPSTVWEDLNRASDPEAPGFREAFNSLADTYWRPVYQYIRMVWRKNNEDAKDLTQEFFLTIFDPKFVAKSNPDRGSFRGFVITSLKNFLANQEKAQKRLKRGGDRTILSLDFKNADGAEMPLPSSDKETPEEYFDRLWARTVLDEAIRTLEKRYQDNNKSVVFSAFRMYCLDEAGETTYRDIAKELQITEKDVDNHIYAARKEFRRAVSETVRQYVSDPAIMEEELKRLFGGPL